LAIVHFTENI